MCVQYNFLFRCGHRGFDKFHNCPDFGLACLGAGGNHKDRPVPDVCTECKRRAAAHARCDLKDPWWEDDPWRKRRKG